MDHHGSRRDEDHPRERREHPGAIARPGTGHQGPGFHDVRVSHPSDDPKLRLRVPREFALGSTASENIEGSTDLALNVIGTMKHAGEVKLLAHELTPLSSELRDLICINPIHSAHGSVIRSRASRRRLAPSPPSVVPTGDRFGIVVATEIEEASATYYLGSSDDPIEMLPALVEDVLVLAARAEHGTDRLLTRPECHRT